MTHSKSISLRVCEEEGIDRICMATYARRGAARGVVHDAKTLCLECEVGPGRSNPTARTLALARRQHQVDAHRLPNRPACRRASSLGWNGGGNGRSVETPISVTESDEQISVCTGVLRFGISTERFALLDYAERGQRNAEGHFVANQSFIGRYRGRRVGHYLRVGACWRHGATPIRYGRHLQRSAGGRRIRSVRGRTGGLCVSSCAAAGPTKPTCPCTTTPATDRCAGLRAYTPTPASRFSVSSTRSYLPEQHAK